MSVELGVAICLGVSVLANVVLVWWARRMLLGTLYIEDSMEDIVHEVTKYSDHLSEVYEMQTYYGDSTLEALLEHTGDLRGYCSDFIDSFSFSLESDEQQSTEKVEDVNEREQPPQAKEA